MDDFERVLAAGLGTWPPGTVLLAAVSGGADSTAMLAALEALRKEKGFRLRCLHVEHGIRPQEESRGDAEAVRELCGVLRVPLKIVSIPPGRVAEAARRLGLGLEGAARLYRRRIWNREARRTGAQRILTAHTRDDLLETILMRILRGSGPGGLAGIVPSGGKVLRPLLTLGREDVLRYLEKRQIPFKTDATNADIRYLRNRVRHKLVPLLDQCFPGWRRSLLSFAETQGLTACFLGRAVREGIHWEAAGDGTLRTGGDAFFSLPPILREEALFLGADLLAAAGRRGRRGEGGFYADPLPRKNPPPRRAVIRRFAAGDASSADLGPVRAGREGPGVSLSVPARGFSEEGFALLIKAPGVYKLKRLVFRAVSAPGDPSVRGEGFYARLPLVLRPRRGDDRIGPGGRSIPFSGYGLDITVEDSRGPAAFIGTDRENWRVLCRRETEDALSGGELFFFTVAAGKTGEPIGGKDAQ